MKKIMLVVSVLLLFSSVSRAATWELLGGTVFLYESDPALTYSIDINPLNNTFTDYEWPGGSFGSINFFNISHSSAKAYFSFDPYFVGEGAFPYIDLETNYANVSSVMMTWNGQTSLGVSVSNILLTSNYDGTYTIAWSALSMAGALSGYHWDMTLNVRDVTAQVVPLPSAFFFFISGLFMILGFVKKPARAAT